MKEEIIINIRNEVIKAIKLFIITILYFVFAFSFNLLLDLYLNEALSLLFAVFLSTVLITRTGINLFGEFFLKKLIIIFPFVSSLIVFVFDILNANILTSKLNIKIVLGTLFVLLIKSILVFCLLYYISKKLSKNFYEKYLKKMENLDKLFSTIKRREKNTEKYRNMLILEIFFLSIITAWFYIFTKLPHYIYFRVFYPIVAISILYFSIKFIRNKI